MPPVRAVLLSAAMLMIPHGHIAHAGDPTRFEILSLQLGRSASEVLQQLHDQGINGAAIEQRRPSCAPAPTTACYSTSDARTRGGRLRITLVGTNPDASAGQDDVLRISYRIVGRGPANANAMREAAIGWYGRPTSVTTDAWCGRLHVATGTCTAGQPVLRIQAMPDAAVLLTLSGDQHLIRGGSLTFSRFARLPWAYAARPLAATKTGTTYSAAIDLPPIEVEGPNR